MRGAWGVFDAGVGLGRRDGWAGCGDDASLRGARSVLNASLVLDRVLALLGLVDDLVGDLRGVIGLLLLLLQELLVGGLLLCGAGGGLRGGRAGGGGLDGDGLGGAGLGGAGSRSAGLRSFGAGTAMRGRGWRGGRPRRAAGARAFVA